MVSKAHLQAWLTLLTLSGAGKNNKRGLVWQSYCALRYHTRHYSGKGMDLTGILFALKQHIGSKNCVTAMPDSLSVN